MYEFRGQGTIQPITPLSFILQERGILFTHEENRVPFIEAELPTCVQVSYQGRRKNPNILQALRRVGHIHLFSFDPCNNLRIRYDY